ncbi:MAG: NADH-quinone oxidoreductase subunit M [Candidatus Bathyarchaeota archaeon]|nr:NADH-quinone oxidoreductase subunit M [Candidatus Bathyarchaeota archaeon]
MAYTLLVSLLIPIVGFPFVYLAGKKSSKAAALSVTMLTLLDLALVLTTVPTVFSHVRYEEVYSWIPVLNSSFMLFVDGISLSMVIMTLIIVLAAVIYSINYMEGKKNLPTYYALITLLTFGLVGVFIASNLLLFYFFWELMIVPAYFILGNWGYKDSYRAAFKFFIYTHAGAVFIILGIGGIYMLTGNLDMTQAATSLMSANVGYLKWILLALTAGFAVKMAVVPLHSWLPDAYSAPAPMSALLSGVLTSAGAYAVVRISLGIVLPAVVANNATFATDFLFGLSIFGVISAFFGSFLALRETDIKRVMAYSSISHMGYILFGFSLFPTQIAIDGTVLQILTHGISKGLFFLTGGALTTLLATRNMHEMGGLAGKIPSTATTSITAALSLAGTPPFACFISEVLIFVGAFQMVMTPGVGTFYMVTTSLMLITTVLSLAYSLRFITNVFFGEPKMQKTKVVKVPQFMQLAMVLLAIMVILVGIYPAFFLNLIGTVHL